jgi:hypothetical protein
MTPTGIMLSNVAAPAECWNCDMQFVRFVDVEAEIL